MSIRFENVRKSFGSRAVLDGVSFEIKKGEILFILGKSGVGKSVTLKHVVGLIKPDSGRVWLDDACVNESDEAGLKRVRRQCGMVFQHPALFDSLSVRENIAFGIEAEIVDRAALDARVRQTLEWVQLDANAVWDAGVESLSYGMKKRVSLARTLAPGPTTLLFDEPTTGLDPITTSKINELILKLSRELRVTSVVVSHDMRSALRVADRVLVLDQGRLLALGTPDETRASREPLIREFLEKGDWKLA